MWREGARFITKPLLPNGDFLIETAANKILKIPASGFLPNGAIRWNPAKAFYVVPTVLPALGNSTYVGPRGHVGLRVDTRGNLYTAFSQTVPGLTSELETKLKAQFPTVPRVHWGAYANDDLARRMKEGMGHTSESNVAKFAKYDAQGRMQWIAGRKATSGAQRGEMYHFWSVAGLVENGRGSAYIEGGSEWGPMTFYTHDGFFVDTIFNDPGQNPPPSPFTFGGETMTGRVQYFPARGEVWAYTVGQAYKVLGFNGGKAAGEQRVYGKVSLDKVYESAAVEVQTAAPLQLVPLAGDALQNPELWANVPQSTLMHDGRPFATAQIGYDAQNLYARLQVDDASPLQNSADTLVTAFKGGDTDCWPRESMASRH